MNEINRLPVGIFDSGLGGLTALAALKRMLPNEDIIYFGDNARIPYGTKSVGLITKYALQDTRFLLSRGVKAILVACGTVSSNCLSEVVAEAGVPVVGVIKAAARAARLAAGEEGLIAVLGTAATVKSKAFERELAAIGCENVVSRACPLFVPLAENRHCSADDVAANAVANEYLSDIAAKRPAAAILGCTHYPLLAPVIARQLPETKLIGSGAEAAADMCALLAEKGLLNPDGGGLEFYTSDDAGLFKENAGVFLGREITERVEKIDVEKF